MREHYAPPRHEPLTARIARFALVAVCFAAVAVIGLMLALGV